MYYTRDILFPFGQLTIASNSNFYLGNDVIANAAYQKFYAQEHYHIYLNSLKEEYACKSYRTLMLKKGLYLGHHLGSPANMVDANNCIYLKLQSPNTEEYNHILWTFALKNALTIMALNTNSLHLKATALRKNNNVILLMGRGGSGKTTLSNFLQNNLGYQPCGNTHVIVHNNYAFGINTWIRERVGGKNHYTVAQNSSTFYDGAISNTYIVTHNSQGDFSAEEISKDLARSFVLHFSSAIGNYDLKEDLIDHYGLNRGLHFFKTNEELVNEYCNSKRFVLLNFDIYSPKSRHELKHYFEEMIKYENSIDTLF